MPYTHTTLAELKTALAGRLADPARVFWVDRELGIHVTEALRTFGILSAFWRERGTFTTTAGTAFYTITDLLSNGSSLLLNYTVTDRDLVEQLQYALLEKASTQASWPGTEQFSYADIIGAIERRRNQFLSDTGCVLTRSLFPVLSPQIGRETLPDTVIDVRRAAWLGASPINYYRLLWREDERALTGFNFAWTVDPRTPEAWSVMGPPPLQLQLAPPPIDSGQLELIIVNSGVAGNPAAVPTLLGIPDDLAWVVKWGALADLLGIDGAARDLQRAQFAESRYQQGVQLARMLPVIVNTEINGISMTACTLQELDAGADGWQNNIGSPSDIAIAGMNLVGLWPVPDNIYSVTMDVVRRTPVPITDGQYIQLGREQIDMILDYAEHLALFKIAGAEWAASQRQANNFLLQSITYNQRLSAAARYVIAPKQSSQKEKYERPRRSESDGLGALPSNAAAEVQNRG